MTSSLPEIVRVESTRRQRTLTRRVDVAGFGFWTGRDVVFSFRPASDDSGVRFFRADLPNSEPIPALVANRVRKPRQTSLAVGSAQVDMIEHVVAALRAAQIDNCDVVVDAPEAPGLDGSGAPFLEALLEAGTVEQTRERIRLAVVAPGRFENDGGGTLDLAPTAENQTILQYNLVYRDDSPIPSQDARVVLTPEAFCETFRREIAPARTFLTLAEANYLREQGICGRVRPGDVLVFDENGPIATELRYENECSRHKILDMFGDFGLAPVDWVGEFRACKTGHQQNADAVAQILASLPN